MRTLILFRHAKSSWGDPDLDDFERPLSPRGERAAPVMGAWLKAQGLRPDVVLCSSAVRTRATLALALEAMGGAAPDVRFDDWLYLAHPGRILASIRALTDDLSMAMVIGHNPGLHALALELTGESSKADVTRLAVKFPTAAIAHLTFDVERWSKITVAGGKLVHFVSPRGLAGT